MPNAAEDIQAARQLLANRHNQTGVPNTLDVARADAHARTATASALDRIAIALEALAANTTTPPAIVRGAIRHTA